MLLLHPRRLAYIIRMLTMQEHSYKLLLGIGSFALLVLYLICPPGKTTGQSSFSEDVTKDYYEDDGKGDIDLGNNDDGNPSPKSPLSEYTLRKLKIRMQAAEKSPKGQQIIQNLLSKYYPQIQNDIVLQHRKKVLQELSGTKFGREDELDLDDLLIERGGKPLRNLIVTSWRCGSTFVGDIIQAHPGVFYHFEPLSHAGNIRVRNGLEGDEGIRVVDSLFDCNYLSIDDYTNHLIQNASWLLKQNDQLRDYCSENIQLCLEPSFLTRFCKLHPIQLIKTVRLGLSLVEPLLTDTITNVLLIIRDPRGTMSSRSSPDIDHWCRKTPDCGSPNSLCGDMESDFEAAKILNAAYPDRFLALRYEDISLNPYSAFKKIFKLFNLVYDARVEKNIKDHTDFDPGCTYSTFKESKTMAFQWAENHNITFEKVRQIQGACTKAMKLWGYKLINNEEVMRQVPLTKTTVLEEPPWKSMVV